MTTGRIAVGRVTGPQAKGAQVLRLVEHLSDSGWMERHPTEPSSGRRLPEQHGGQRGRRQQGAVVPMSLGRPQLHGQKITYPSQYIRVEVWVPFTDGTHQRVRALAVAWTEQAVKVVWRAGGEDPVESEAWVWAQAVTRSPLPGPHPTDNPATDVYPLRRPAAASGPVPEFRPSVRPPRTYPW